MHGVGIGRMCSRENRHLKVAPEPFLDCTWNSYSKLYTLLFLRIRTNNTKLLPSAAEFLGRFRPTKSASHVSLPQSALADF